MVEASKQSARTWDNGGFSREQKLYMMAKADFQVRLESAQKEYPPTLDEQAESQLSKVKQRERDKQKTAANKRYQLAESARNLQDAEFLVCLWGTQQGLEMAERLQKPQDKEVLKHLRGLLEQRNIQPEHLAQLVDLTMNLDPRNNNWEKKVGEA